MKKLSQMELEGLRLGEFDEEQTQAHLDLLIGEEGNTDRLDRLIQEDDVFLKKYPPHIFSAQVSARIRYEEREKNRKKITNKSQPKLKKQTYSSESKMMFSKRIAAGCTYYD